MNHDFCVRESETLALCAASEQECAHGCGGAHADSVHITLDVLHGVVDCQTSSDRAARRIDVEENILVGVFGLQEKHLADDGIRSCVSYFVTQEDDSDLEQTGKQVVRALTALSLFDNIRDIHKYSFLSFLNSYF